MHDMSFFNLNPELIQLIKDTQKYTTVAILIKNRSNIIPIIMINSNLRLAIAKLRGC